jgi:protein-tyrosine-phosphatase
MASTHRQFKLRIWWLGLGYFIFYAPYSAFIKAATTAGLLPGMSAPVSGFRLLPATIISTAITLPLIISLMGWWKYAGRRQFFGLNVPCPSPLIFLSGLGTAIIIGTTTLAFTFTGISIVFALLLMRVGVLVIAPVVDLLFKRRVRWFSGVALWLSLAALAVALLDADNYRMSRVAALNIAAYLAGYLLRLPCVTRLAKSDDKATTYRYFVEELMVAMLFLVAIPVVFALVGRGEIMMELRHGFTDFFSSGVTLPALLIGALYAGLYCFGTLIYLDCRENTFCIPLNRGSSLLAGIFASYALALFFGQRSPSEAQLSSATLIVIALLFLSPLHHFERTLAKFSHAITSLYRRLLDFAEGLRPREPTASPRLQTVLAENAQPIQRSDEEHFNRLRQVFLFVCSGNTCRSPIAAAIGNAEIAARLKIPFEALDQARVQARSAGISARVGAPMTQEAQQALRLLNVPFAPHVARNLTVELAHQVEMIFCMTRAHREAVIRLIPSVAGKTHCLDPEGDIEDPIGSGLEAYLECARHIHRLVRLRLDEAQLIAN